MSIFGFILLLVSGAGIIVALIRVIINCVKKKDCKKIMKIFLGFITAFMLAIILIVNSPDTDNQSPTSDSSVQTVSNQVKEKTAEEIAAEEKADEEATKKLEQEENAKKAEEAKEAQKFIKKNTKRLSAGEHLVGKHLDPSTYEVTFNGSGNFFVHSSTDEPLTNEIGGSSLGIKKYRAILPDGAKIKLSGMSINVKPTKPTLKPYTTINLYAGYWITGQDVTNGRYEVKVISGSGNFFIYDKDGVIKTNEILGGSLGVKDVAVDLEDGDIINIAGMNNVKFSPAD